MAVSEEEYKLKFFVDKGFVRKKCRVCNAAFWTLDESREVCGDSPCQEYEFIGRELKANVDVSSIRRLFLGFFEGKDHRILKPYPVVARWRDDIYLTIASIAVFQPFVTEGIVPPPANPLVISQPCIRLVDIDNVGLTAGRHLTIFEMGGHHAFNYPGEEVYWKEETVEYCHEFLTNLVGIDEKSITYKEDFWVGGGNAGPDVEVCVDGLELATLVFMCLKVVDEEKYVPMPVKVVDTGYGIERFTWFLTGKPTAFHAIYGNLINDVAVNAGLEVPDEELLSRVARASALMRVERGKTLEELRRELSSVTKIPLEVLEREVAPFEMVSALVDHSKCIAFMLSDGVVPSNVGEGYLARLVIRRGLRLCNLLRLEEGYLKRLVNIQLNLWSDFYPKLLEAKKAIDEILDLEEEKFKLLVSRGRSFILKALKELKGKSLPLDSLLQLYDSHGLPPELVKEEAENLGVKLQVPGNFYGLVARLHQQTRASKAQPEYDVRGLPPTKALYYEDQHQLVFEAKVLKSGEGYVILDQTCFYPRGGGQDSDRGLLLHGDLRVEVVDAVKVGDVVVHVINGKIPEGVRVKGEVNAERRLGLTRHHSATHVLLEAIRRVIGVHAWQSGAQKWPDRAHIDITHYKQLSPQELETIENLANNVVFKNLPVKTYFLGRRKAEDTYGLEIYQGGVVPGKDVRIVEVEGWNAQACGGTHVSSTGEIGLIKVVKVDRIQDGILRFEFKAGRAALDYVRELEKQMYSTAQVLESSVDQVPYAASKLKLEVKQLRKEVEKLKSRVMESLMPSIRERYRRGEQIIDVELVDVDYDDMIALAEKAVREMSEAVLLLLSRRADNSLLTVACGPKAIEKGFEANRVASEIVQVAGGKAGGKRDIAKGIVEDLNKVKEKIKELNLKLL
ncbi:MAG: alanine--tRNA ligase [Candidatus Nezhaarchaeota archaeon]|nr:alanine--tRNA ligase [Candidatus Nezhaarchaeota archaeon]